MKFELTPEVFFGITSGDSVVADKLMKLNERSSQLGLSLTADQAKMLVQNSRESLISHDRVEFGESVVTAIAEKFMNSSYISASDYAETLAELTEVFYEAKDECCDVLSDAEVIDIMFDFFENESGGSIDVLQNRDMEYMCRKIRLRAANIKDDDYDE